MRYQDIAKKKQRVKRLFWILLILLLGLVSSGWLYPLGAEVLLCGDPLFPDPDGIYRLRGHLTCLPTDPDTDPILDIKGDDVADSKFDLRGLIATGDGDNTGIRIRDGADNVTIVGGIFKKCKTALRVEADDCDIENFKAIDSSGRAFRIKGDYNDIVKSLCLKAGEACFEVEGEYNDLIRLKAIDSSENAIIEKKGSDNNFLSRCMSLRAGSDAFELRANGLPGTTTEYLTAIKSGTPEKPARGIRFRGPGYAYKCSAFGNSAEGFQIQDNVSDVTIERCITINNAQDGIEIEEAAIGNYIKRNIVFANGDGIDFFDLTDGNYDCDNNEWKRNKFKTSNIECIE